MDIENIFEGASWICVPECKQKIEATKNRPGIEVAYFRNTFNLTALGKLELYISASTRYRLWVNGHHVTSGPCKGDRWSHYYEKLDVSQFLLEGKNIIAVKVVAYPPYEARTENERGPIWSMSNAAGTCLVVKGACKDEKGKIITDITTGKVKWSVHNDNAVKWKLFTLSHWMGSMEIVNGDKLPYGWKENSSPGGEWVDAAIKWPVEKNMYGLIPVFPLKERPVPLLYERKRQFTGELPVKKGEYEAFSFRNGVTDKEWKEVHLPPFSKKVIEISAGELTTGYFNLPLSGGKGSKITICYAESYSLNNPGQLFTVRGVRDDAENFDLIGHEDVYFPSGKDETYEPFWFRTFRFIRIEVETGSEELIIHPPYYIETGYPLEVKSWIESSEEWIKGLWDISVRTLERCMHETYEDCPYYEQLQYTLDSRLEMLFTYIISNDTRMALRTIEDYHSSLMPEGIIQSRYPSSEPQVIPAFSLYWIFMLEDYYWQTGDITIARRYRPTIDSILDWYDRKSGSLGMVEKLGYWEFIDWVEEWSYLEGTPPAALAGPSTTHNLIYAYALQVASRLSSLTGRNEVAVEYIQRSDKILEAIEKYCWCENMGMYKEGPNFEEFSQHAQIWAILSGLAKGEKAQAIMEKVITGKSMSICSFAWKFFLFRALEETGQYGATESQWEYWRYILKLNLTTIPETPVNPRSECHAWGALPLYEFTRKFLGVNPLVPGWEKIVIEPKCFFVNDAKGEVITPKGIVQVEWKNENGELKISGKVPDNIPFVLKLPGNKEYMYSKGGTFEKTCHIYKP